MMKRVPLALLVLLVLVNCSSAYSGSLKGLNGEPSFSLPQNVDHIVFVATDLESGMDAIEARLGVRPVPGGRHPQYGTHNALLSLGEGMYLEVLAPDPSLPAPEQGRLTEGGMSTPHLLTWVVRTDDITTLADTARRKDASIGAISAGERERPDGTVLRWQLSDPYALPLDGAVPFLIDWGDTPHPSGAVPEGGRLVGLMIEHPDPQSVRSSLQALNIDLEVREAASYRLIAAIDTDAGLVLID